ncbi:hypothetical protein T484DRAFT_3629141 [Baffinella frigidus]|nr:hypothetical protein T484DRAFT_3629141 [Cryptophyta sp. CCMP2293]
MAPQGHSTSNSSNRVGARTMPDAAWVAVCRERHSANEINEEEWLFLSFLSAVNSPTGESRQLGPRAYRVAATPRIEIAGAHGQVFQADAIGLLNDISLAPAEPPKPERKRRKVEALEFPHVSKSTCLPTLGTSVLLPVCKFVSKNTCVECADVPRVATHKRGYLACACAQGHQWVWCAKCCACPRPALIVAGAEVRGCNNGAHWFERDAFDTGRRNHMNRHEDK